MQEQGFAEAILTPIRTRFLLLRGEKEGAIKVFSNFLDVDRSDSTIGLFQEQPARHSLAYGRVLSKAGARNKKP